MDHLISVRIVNLDTNEEEVFYEKEGSRCYFKKWFSFENYEIQLRLDWDDVANGEPMLDADIKDKTSDKPIKKGRWHHIKMQYDPQANRRTYTFDFRSLRLRLYIIKTMVMHISGNAFISRGSER